MTAVSSENEIGSDPTTVLNMNVGVLGHVDSGKTSLVKALSTLLSTAALDKSKESRQRGMTLDLGFSCFFMDLPVHWQSHFPNKSSLQITLVDCPGHASLIRTIIGGAQIIDLVLLVVDAYKGWQAQTTECLVLAELTSPFLVVALNKADMFPPDQRERALQLAQKKVQERLQGTRFEKAPMVGVAACVGGEKVAAVSSEGGPAPVLATNKNETWNLEALIDLLQQTIPPPRRTPTGPFYFAIDHCFSIRGRGTVLTGTVLNGSIAINDNLEFPTLALERKVKSMQMFKQQVPSLQQGDRAGICVSNLDAKLMERGLAATPGSVPLWKGALALVQKIKYFAGPLPGGAKFHISVGHATVMATVTFWGARELGRHRHHHHHSRSATLEATRGSWGASLGGEAGGAGWPQIPFDFQQDFLQQEDLLEKLDEKEEGPGELLLHWALLDFQIPVYCPLHSLVIGSRLDAVDNSTGASSSCRLAFSGRLIERVDPEKDAKRIRLYNPKEKRGVIAKLGDPHRRSDDQRVVRYEVFGADLFKKETNMKVFLGMKVETSSGDIGEIKSSYGTSGRFRVYFPAGTEAREGDELILRFKRYVHDPDKAMHQDISLPAARSGARIEVEKKKKKKEEKLPPGVNRVGEIASVKGDVVLASGKYATAIVSGFFSPEINVKERVGTKVMIPSTGEEGSIVGPFGKAGKCKVTFADGVSAPVGAKAELLL